MQGSAHRRLTARAIPINGPRYLCRDIKGGALDYEPFYCTTIIWDWDDGTSSENTADCPPYESGQSEIRRYYSSTHTYCMAGRYNVRFRMKKGDRVVGGSSTVVQVRPGLRDPSEPPM